MTIKELRDFLYEVEEELENNLVDDGGVSESEYDNAMERIENFEYVLNKLENGGDPLEVAHKLAYEDF